MAKCVNCVLLIDDDRATNFFNRRLVSKHQCFNTVNTVQSGLAALEYLIAVENNDAIKPDLIFLDVNMPAMNGWEFLVEFSKFNPDVVKGIKVIMLTTSSDLDDLDQSKGNESVNDFLNKPLSSDVLDTVLQNHF